MSKSIKLQNNTYLDSSGVVFNHITLKDLLTYSTTERVIGKWINGKPIYRKVVTGNGKNKQVTTISNLEQIITMKGIIYSIYAQWWNIPNWHSETGYGTTIYCNTSGGIQLSAGNFYNDNSPYIIILEYTKTTD